MTPYDPREPLPQWGVRGWAWRVIAVGSAMFWIVVGLGLFIAITAR